MSSFLDFSLSPPQKKIVRLSNYVFLQLHMLLQAFNEVQNLLSKTNGKVVGDLMTPAPVVVRESSNLEDAARLFNSSSFSCFLFILFFPLLLLIPWVPPAFLGPEAKRMTFWIGLPNVGYCLRQNIVDFQL